MKRHLAMALVLAAPLLLLGCEKRITEPEPPVFTYPDRSTPKNTVLRMAAAFERRDSVVTGSVYSDTYEGSSTDIFPPGETLTFTKADEVRAVGAMALSQNVVSADMELYSPTTWSQTHYAADPAGWVTIQFPYFRISVQDGENGFYVNPTSYETWIFEFTLEPTTPDSSSPTDTTWTIVRWAESRAHN